MTERTTPARTRNPFRRTAVVALVAMAATGGATLSAGSAGAAEEFVAGSGKAKASIIRVGPSAAQLSLAPSVGVALADFIGTLGRGEALIFDYAALDGSINGGAPDLKREFPPLRVESRDAGSEAGVRWEPKPGIVENAQATGAPVGRSSVAIEGFNVPGVVEVTGGKARSFAGVYTRTVDGKKQLIRVAGGTVDIPRVSLGGGAVVLQNLRWEGAQVTDRNDDTEPEAFGGFVVGRMIVNGVEEGKGLTGKELAQIFGPLNEQVLSNVGLFVEAPTAVLNGDVMTVTPLRIRLASSHFAPLGEAVQQLRDAPSDDPDKTLSQRIIEECQAGEGDDEEEGGGASGSGSGGPLGRPDPGPTTHGQAAGSESEREEFTEFDSNGPDGQHGDPNHEPPGAGGGSDCGLPFLVADLLVGPLTGAGRLDLELGGVSGLTEGGVFNNFNFNFTPGGFDVPPVAEFPVDDFEVAESPTSVLGEQVEAAAPVGGSEQQGSLDTTAQPAPEAPRPLKLTGSRASAAWAVGLVGLGAALAMAATDYRRLRTRRRLITPIT